VAISVLVETETSYYRNRYRPQFLPPWMPDCR